MEAHVATIAHPLGLELAPEPRREARIVGWLFAGAGLALFAVMGLLGLAMRLTQANALDVSPAWFYRLMTLHGAGMLAGALLAMMGALWFVLHATVPLSFVRGIWSFALVVGGAVTVLVAVVVGGFATGWTFLAPLPFFPSGAWSPWATAAFLTGLALVGAGFFVFCVDVLTSLTFAYGGLRRALGIAFLRGADEDPPPPQAIAATVVALEGLLASAVGTTILMALLGRTIDGDVAIDALWAKNLTYFFGHSLANLIIYLAVGAIYVLLPRYAGRPWKTTKPIVVAWLGTLLFVATAYSHHLYMDFVQPGAAQVMSTIASSGAALPVAVVTIYTGMMLVWGSRYRWTLASTLTYLGFAGWAIGGTGAVIDSVIPFNLRLHNSLWVPAHFHTYLMLGVVFWLMAFLAHMLERAASRPASRRATVLAPALMSLGGYGLVGAWYLSGALGVPRRYAVHPEGTEGYSVAASVFVAVFAVGFLVLLAEFARLALDARRRPAPASPARAPTAGAGGPPAPHGGWAPLIASPIQLALAVAAGTVALLSLAPPVVDAADANAQYHHLDHAAQFFLGAILAVAVVSTRVFTAGRVPRPGGLALAVAVLAPAAMLLAMLPGIYDALEDRGGLHVLYHVGVIALGALTGWAVTRFGRVTGWLLFALSVGMAAMYAGGVTGG